MKEGILIVLSKHDFSYQAIEKDGYDVDCPYRGNSMPLRLVRELFFRFKLPGKSLWYNTGVNKNADSIIVYNALITKEYMYWLRKHNPHSQIVYFYSDPVEKSIDPRLLPDDICEKWSSDIFDCKNYGLHQGKEGGYFRFWTVDKVTPEYDVLFVGRDKGRLEDLLKLRMKFERLGLKTNFYITAYHRYQKYKNKIYRPLIPYSEVLKMIGRTRAILHLTEGGYKGISIRILESIIHEVKLITDNPYIKQLDIYRPNNFFVLGEDDINNLPAFLEIPYEPYDKEYVDSLYYESWIDYMVKV